MSLASNTVKLGVASVAVPGVAFLVGLALSGVIPNCHCDEGAGCRGCAGFDGLLGLMIFGGFAGALAAFLTALPASLLLAAAFKAFSKPEPRASSVDELVGALNMAVGQFLNGNAVKQRCPACTSNIDVGMVDNDDGSTRRVKTSCSCGRCTGIYDVAK